MILSLSPTLSYFILAVAALIVGSFLNVVIYRLPLMLYHEMAPLHGEQLKLNLFLPRSFCPHCKHRIQAIYNVPLLSYWLLKRRCKYCKANIAARYVLVECLTLLLALLAAWQFGFSAKLIFALLFLCLILCLSFIDLSHQLLPDNLTLSLLWLGLLANTQSLFTPLAQAVEAAAFAYLFLMIINKLFYILRGKDGIGHGDFKLFAAFGAWFGWTQLPLILLLASALGALTGLIYLKIKKKDKNTPIPFGPFLCLGGIVSLFWGSRLGLGPTMTFFI